MRPYTHHPILRWLSVILRGVHIVAVIGLGSTIMGAPLSLHHQSIYVLASGIAMFALDLWNKPRMLLEWSGVALIIKLGAVVLMVFNTELLIPLFWGIVFWSAIFSHAPASFRHATWWH